MGQARGTEARSSPSQKSVLRRSRGRGAGVPEPGPGRGIGTGTGAEPTLRLGRGRGWGRDRAGPEPGPGSASASASATETSPPQAGHGRGPPRSERESGGSAAGIAGAAPSRDRRCSERGAEPCGSVPVGPRCRRPGQRPHVASALASSAERHRRLGGLHPVRRAASTPGVALHPVPLTHRPRLGAGRRAQPYRSGGGSHADPVQRRRRAEEREAAVGVVTPTGRAAAHPAVRVPTVRVPTVRTRQRRIGQCQSQWHRPQQSAAGQAPFTASEPAPVP